MFDASANKLISQHYKRTSSSFKNYKSRIAYSALRARPNISYAIGLMAQAQYEHARRDAHYAVAATQNTQSKRARDRYNPAQTFVALCGVAL